MLDLCYDTGSNSLSRGRNQYSVPFVATEFLFSKWECFQFSLFVRFLFLPFLLLFGVCLLLLRSFYKGRLWKKRSPRRNIGSFRRDCIFRYLYLQLILTHTLPVCFCDHIIHLLLRGLGRSLEHTELQKKVLWEVTHSFLKIKTWFVIDL